MPRIKLIATDIDGTILKYNFEFNQEVKDCITKLTQKGVKVVLVTGRMHSATDYIAEELGLDTPIVSYQGALVKSENEILYERHIDPNRAREIIHWACKNNVHLNLYMDDQLYVERDDAVIRRYTGERSAGFTVKSFEEIELKNINKLLVIDFEDTNKVTMWKDYLENKFEDLHFVKSMPFFCEVCHPEATKYHAVNCLKDFWGLKTEEILTIGDQDNDIALLKAGGIKVAMGNATEGLKAVANYITDTVNNNGFVKAIEKFVYNKIEV
ncbi:MAG: Cof-type HAD-IIB family hydrolase [Candidatus Gastranaerophilales bacterium]|nr:Cof-type HAD-IIB family hydrolase [Candidatus Gastranaerophilales bacterium]